MGYKSDMTGVRTKIQRICHDENVGRFAASEVERLAKQYVPYRDSHLVESSSIEPFHVYYKMPYAKYQWYGVSKLGNKFKNYTTPGTSSRWTDNLNKKDLSRSISDYINGMG